MNQIKLPGDLPGRIHVQRQDHIAFRGFFFVGGDLEETDGIRKYIHGQMYVEVMVPHEIKHPYPIIFFHGGGQTGLNWMMTPDGRMGWADYFVKQGYLVYVPDVPARGRSPYHPEADGQQIYMTADLTNEYFASSDGGWPNACRHTQWPDVGEHSGERYDPVYLALCKAQYEYLPPKQQQERVKKAGIELLQCVGESILVTHSMAGPYGWILADACPELIHGIVALEPSGPPFAGISISKGRQRPYGIADIPLTYSPNIRLPKWRSTSNDPIIPPAIEDTDAWLQPEPAGQLINMQTTPILMLTAEASYHAPFDHLTAAFLRQAGVPVRHIRLEEVGIHGNGHMMMMEKNNIEIAAFIQRWVEDNVERRAT